MSDIYSRLALDEPEYSFIDHLTVARITTLYIYMYIYICLERRDKDHKGLFRFKGWYSYQREGLHELYNKTQRRAINRAWCGTNTFYIMQQKVWCISLFKSKAREVVYRMCVILAQVFKCFSKRARTHYRLMFSVCPAGWKPGSDTIKPDVQKSKEFFSKHW